MEMMFNNGEKEINDSQMVDIKTEPVDEINDSQMVDIKREPVDEDVYGNAHNDMYMLTEESWNEQSTDSTNYDSSDALFNGYKTETTEKSKADSGTEILVNEISLKPFFQICESVLNEMKYTYHICSECGKTFKQYPSSEESNIEESCTENEQDICDECKNMLLKSYICCMCGETFNTQHPFTQDHFMEQSYAANKRNICDKCKQKPSLKVYACHICGKTFVCQQYPSTHENDLEQPYIENKQTFCYECERKATPESYVQLQSSFEEEKSYGCKMCHKYFVSEFELSTHELIHTVPGNAYSCDICSKLFLYKRSLNKHKQTHTKQEKDTHKRKKKKLLSRDCPICHRTFSKAEKMRKHQKMHLSDNPYICDICFIPFRRERDLGQHEKDVHTNGRPYTCDVCGKFFITSLKLKSHVRVHTGEGPFYCDTCGAKFQHLDDLGVHKALSCHKSCRKRPLICTCPKEKDADIDAEEKSDEGVEDQQCKLSLESDEDGTQKEANTSALDPLVLYCLECNKSFSQESEFRIHNIQHYNLSEKPYVCGICKEGFAKEEDVLLHNVSHRNATTDQLHECIICSVLYSKECDLKVHQIKHRGFDLKCRYCPDIFTDEKQFIAHLKAHIVCVICVETFETKWELKKHRRSVHNIQIKR